MPRDRESVVFHHYGDTQRFTLANRDTNTTTDVLPSLDNLDMDYEIVFLNLDEGGEETKVKIESGWTMQVLCTAYAKEKGKHVKSFRFAYAGQPLFLSSIGKKLVTQVGLVNRDVVVVSSVELPLDEVGGGANNAKKGGSKCRSKKGKKAKGKGGGKKKSGPRPVIEVKRSDQEEHSKAFSHVLREAEPRFKDIRQKLNALTLERTLPKQKSTSKKETGAPQDKPVYRLGNDDRDTKAGKPYYLVLVGEVANLYKTAKGSTAQKQRTRSLDLHGLTSKEAIAKLDEKLMEWVDIAMGSSYLFVIPVAIVCGGGNQVLSETVAKWIKSNREVANAPKNYHG